MVIRQRARKTVLVCLYSAFALAVLLTVNAAAVATWGVNWIEAAVVASTVLIAVNLRRAWRVVAVVLCIAGWVLVPTMISFLAYRLPGGSPVAGAVGSGAFFGYSYQAFQRSGLLSVICLLAAVVLTFWIKRVRERTGSLRRSSRARRMREPVVVCRIADSQSATFPPLIRILGGILGVSVLALAGTLFLPDVRSLANGFDVGAIYRQIDPASFDLGNALYWASAFSEHGVGMRDIVFPYGETWLFLRFPLGTLIDWATRVTTLLLLYLVLRRGDTEPYLRSVAAVAAVTVLMIWWSGLPRYLTAILVGAAFAVYLNDRFEDRRRSLFLVLMALALALFWGADQFLYGIGGAIVVMGSTWIRSNPSWLSRSAMRDLLGLMARVLVPVVVVGASYIAYWALIGTLEQRVLYSLHLSDVSAFASGPLSWSAVELRTGFIPVGVNASLAIPAVVCAVGLLVALGGDPRYRVNSGILLATGGVLALFLMKHLIRNQGDIALKIGIVAILIFAIMTIGSIEHWRKMLPLFALLPVMIITAQETQVGPRTSAAIRALPDVLEGNTAVLLGKASVPAAADVFSIAELPEWTPETPVMERLDRYAARTGVGFSQIAVVGNAPLLYLRLGQQSTFGLNLYDASPHYLQDLTLAQLDGRSPEVIVFENERFVDGIPYTARVPKLVRWVVDNYRPVDRPLPAWVIARRVQNKTPSQYGAWAEVLGTRIDLGSMPAYSSGPEGTICSQGSVDCSSWLRVSRVPAGTKTVSLQAPSTSGTGVAVWEATFQSISSVTVYWVRVDRLWFSPVVSRHAKWVCSPSCDVRELRQGKSSDLW